MEDKKKSDSGENTENSFIREKIVKQSDENRYKKLGAAVILVILCGIAAGTAFALVSNRISNSNFSNNKEAFVSSDFINEESEYETALNSESTEALQESEAPVLSQEEQKKQIYEEVSRSFLTISAVKNQGVDWFDSRLENEKELFGVIIQVSDNEILLLSNADSLDGSETMSTVLAGRTVSVSIKQKNSADGIALLSINIQGLGIDTSAIFPIEIGNSESIQLGDTVMIMGSPVGYSPSFMYGTITYQSSSTEALDGEYKIYYTDQGSVLGEAGVFLNQNGKLVGWLTSHYKLSNLSQIQAAIGINSLRDSINNMIIGNNTALLGVFSQDVTSAIAEQTKIPQGCYVTGVEEGSPAYESGIQTGDVITKIDDSNITTGRSLIRKISGYKQQDIINVTVERKGKDGYREMSISVTLSAR